LHAGRLFTQRIKTQELKNIEHTVENARLLFKAVTASLAAGDAMFYKYSLTGAQFSEPELKTAG